MTKKKAGRKTIPEVDKKVTAGLWIKRKNLAKVKPILKTIIKHLDI